MSKNDIIDSIILEQMVKMGISYEEVIAAISTVTRSGYNLNNIDLNPSWFPDFFYRDIILKDNTKIHISDVEYMDYTKMYNPPEWDTSEEFELKINDLRMVEAL